MTAPPVSLSKEELAEVKRQSEMQVHHDYIIPRLLATIESRDQHIGRLVAIVSRLKWGWPAIVHKEYEGNGLWMRKTGDMLDDLEPDDLDD